MPRYAEPGRHPEVDEIIALCPRSVEIVFRASSDAGSERIFRVHARETLRGDQARFFAEFEVPAFVPDHEGTLVSRWAELRPFIGAAWGDSVESALDLGISRVVDFVKRTPDENDR